MTFLCLLMTKWHLYICCFEAVHVVRLKLSPPTLDATLSPLSDLETVWAKACVKGNFLQDLHRKIDSLGPEARGRSHVVFIAQPMRLTIHVLIEGLTLFLHDPW